MATATISFKTPGPTNGAYAVPERSDIPVFKGRRRMSVQRQLKALDNALEDLARSPCAFWACDGARRPRHMATCCKCWAMREIAIVRAAIARAAGV